MSPQCKFIISYIVHCMLNINQQWAMPNKPSTQQSQWLCCPSILRSLNDKFIPAAVCHQNGQGTWVTSLTKYRPGYILSMMSPWFPCHFINKSKQAGDLDCQLAAEIFFFKLLFQNYIATQLHLLDKTCPKHVILMILCIFLAIL